MEAIVTNGDKRCPFLLLPKSGFLLTFLKLASLPQNKLGTANLSSQSKAAKKGQNAAFTNKKSGETMVMAKKSGYGIRTFL